MKINSILKKLNILILSLAINLPTCTFAEPKLIDELVAIVNSEAITLSQLNRFIKLNMGDKAVFNDKIAAQALDELITLELQLQVANRSLGKIAISEEKLNQSVKDIASSNGITTAEFVKGLEEKGIDYSAFREQLKQQITVQEFQRAFLSSTISVSSKERENFLKSKENIKQIGILYNTKQITVSTEDFNKNQKKELEEELLAVSELTDKGMEIPENIKEKYSDRLSQTSTHQALPINEYPSNIANIIMELKDGQASGVIKTSKDFRIVQLIDRELANAPEPITRSHIRHILIKNDDAKSMGQIDEKIKFIDNELKNGKAFEDVAKAHSEENSSAIDGGDIGWHNPHTLDPNFSKEIEKLEINEISKPIKSSYGWHFAQVLERKADNDIDTIISSKVHQILFITKAHERLESWLKSLRNGAYIKKLKYANSDA